jgi:hypothetical protein
MAPQGIGKFGAHGFGCCDCNEAGPFGSYSWSVAGDELTLRAKERCPSRRDLGRYLDRVHGRCIESLFRHPPVLLGYS